MNSVFLVDDEKFVLKSFIATIDWKSEGFVVVGESTDGSEAVKKIIELQPDLVFVDVRMPGIGGLEVLRIVHESYPNINFAMVSGHNEFVYAQEAMRLGALDYCLKPFSRTEIHRVLRRVKEIVATRNNGTSKAENENKPVVNTRNETLKKILAYIHENYTKNLTIEQIAKSYSLNQNYISQLFKRETGKTFTEYIMELRIRYANELLRSTNLPISEIAELSGYPDYFYFARVYKKVTGITPSQFRQKSNMG